MNRSGYIFLSAFALTLAITFKPLLADTAQPDNSVPAIPAQEVPKAEIPNLENIKMVGVGLVITQDDASKKFFVRKIAVDSPASKADIKEGDEILEIDGRATDKRSIDECANEIRGQAGTPVKLTILRDGTKKTIEVVRGEFTIPRTHGMCPAKDKS